MPLLFAKKFRKALDKANKPAFILIIFCPYLMALPSLLEGQHPHVPFQLILCNQILHDGRGKALPCLDEVIFRIHDIKVAGKASVKAKVSDFQLLLGAFDLLLYDATDCSGQSVLSCPHHRPEAVLTGGPAYSSSRSL